MKSVFLTAIALFASSQAFAVCNLHVSFDFQGLTDDEKSSISTLYRQALARKEYTLVNAAAGPDSVTAVAFASSERRGRQTCVTAELSLESIAGAEVQFQLAESDGLLPDDNSKCINSLSTSGALRTLRTLVRDSVAKFPACPDLRGE